MCATGHAWKSEDLVGVSSSLSLCGFGDGTQVTSQTLAFLFLWTCDWLTREMTDVTRCVTDVL